MWVFLSNWCSSLVPVLVLLMLVLVLVLVLQPGETLCRQSCVFWVWPNCLCLPLFNFIFENDRYPITGRWGHISPSVTPTAGHKMCPETRPDIFLDRDGCRLQAGWVQLAPCWRCWWRNFCLKKNPLQADYIMSMAESDLQISLLWWMMAVEAAGGIGTWYLNHAIMMQFLLIFATNTVQPQ